MQLREDDDSEFFDVTVERNVSQTVVAVWTKVWAPAARW